MTETKNLSTMKSPWLKSVQCNTHRIVEMKEALNMLISYGDKLQLYFASHPFYFNTSIIIIITISIFNTFLFFSCYLAHQSTTCSRWAVHISFHPSSGMRHQLFSLWTRWNYSFYPISTLGKNVCLQEFFSEFVTGSCWVKNQVTRSNFRKNLVNYTVNNFHLMPGMSLLKSCVFRWAIKGHLGPHIYFLWK